MGGFVRKPLGLAKSEQLVKNMSCFTDNDCGKALCTSSKYPLFRGGTPVLGFTDDSRICSPFRLPDSLMKRTFPIAVGERSLGCAKREMLNTLSELLTDFAVAWVSVSGKIEIRKSLKYRVIRMNFLALRHYFSGWHMPCI